MRKRRHAEILSIINEYEVENQEMMKELLEKRGYKVTQATISRDLNELDLEKGVSKNGVSCYMKANRANKRHYENIFVQSVLKVDHAGSIVCVKCHSGMANAVCSMLDSINLENVVGTIAGDDTIFILCRTEDDTKALSDQLRKMM